MGFFKSLYRLPSRINRSFETISGATGFESGAGKLTTYMTGVKTLGQKMEGSTRPHDAEAVEDGLKPD
jgi:hypothetical protein